MKQELQEAAKFYEEAESWRYEAFSHPKMAAFIAGAEWHDRSLNWIRDLVKVGINKPEEAVAILKRIDVLLNEND
jgi:hypothetical protein